MQNNEEMFNHAKAPGFIPYRISEAKQIVRNLKPGKNVQYRKDVLGNVKYSNKKVGKTRIGMQIIDINKSSPTITGSLAFYRSDLRRPLTCRERARIQGIPDWFEFILKDKDKFNDVMGTQTGKGIPNQFISYFTRSIWVFLNKEIKLFPSKKRRLKNDLVNDSKEDNCINYPHSNQRKLCSYCDYSTCRSRKI